MDKSIIHVNDPSKGRITRTTLTKRTKKLRKKRKKRRKSNIIILE